MSGLEINSLRKDAETFQTEHCSGARGDYNFYRVLDLMRNSSLKSLFIFISGYLNISEGKSLEKAHPLSCAVFLARGFQGGSTMEKLEGA